MRTIVTSLLALGICLTVAGADPIFSGPQPGEKITSFKSLEIKPGAESKERDPVTENKGAPTAFVFVHTVERSLVPLLKAIDEYGATQSNKLKTEVIFLAPNRLEGEQRTKAVLGSLKLKSRTGLSLDGAEGPGNFGLNKECMMTIVGASNNLVMTNFAFVQPGIADAHKVVTALARLAGDTNPPTEAQLLAAQSGRMAMRPERGAPEMTAPQGEKFPGAVPTDPKLNQFVRQFIRKTNDVATIDKLRSQIEAHIKDNPDLQKQTADGWARVLHFGDHYGTEYARSAAKEMMGKYAAPGSDAKK
jgi:hypothetical protein